MEILNRTLDTFSSHIAEFSVSLNTDIFEANVVNLIILVGGVVYLGGNALTASLEERQQKILGAIQESEERLEQAMTKLIESEKQLAQTQIVIESLLTTASSTAAQVKSGILTEGKKEIERLSLVAKAQISTIEVKIRKQISEYVVSLALQRVTLQLEGKLDTNLQKQIINRNISKLAG